MHKEKWVRVTSCGWDCSIFMALNLKPVVKWVIRCDSFSVPLKKWPLPSGHSIEGHLSSWNLCWISRFNWCQTWTHFEAFFAFLRSAIVAVRGFGSFTCWEAGCCTWNGECPYRNPRPGWTCLWLPYTHKPLLLLLPLPRLLSGFLLEPVSAVCHFWEWWQMGQVPSTSKTLMMLPPPPMQTSWEFKKNVTFFFFGWVCHSLGLVHTVND